MKRKLLSMFCVVISLVLLMGTITTNAGYYGSETDMSGMYFDFETEADYEKADGNNTGNTPYYNYCTDGTSVSAGCLMLAPENISNEASVSGGFVNDAPILTQGVTYRLSFKAMVKSGETAKTVWPLIRLKGADGTIEDAGTHASYTAGAAFSNQNPYWNAKTAMESSIVADGKWRDYSYEFVFTDDNFTLGSSTKIALTSYSKVGVAFRCTNNSTGNVYIDDLAIEPVKNQWPISDFGFSEGAEVVDNGGITKLGDSTPSNTGYSESSPAPVVCTVADNFTAKFGRAYASRGGKDGDGAYMLFANHATPQVSFNGNSGKTYNISEIEANQLYRVSIRAKAPDYVTDATVESDSTYYLDGETGVIRTKTAKTNGKQGANLVFWITHAGAKVYANFVGSAELTGEWIDYIGYMYQPMTAASSNANTYIYASVTGGANEGVFMIDDMSIKPVDDANLVPNGNLSLVSGSDVVALDGLSVSNGIATASSAVTTTVSLADGKNYELSVRAKASNTGTMNISLTNGATVQAIAESASITNEMATYKYTFTAATGIGVVGDVAAELSISGATEYEYIRLVEAPSCFVENIAISNELMAGRTTTVTWDSTTVVQGASCSCFIKVFAGDDINGYCLFLEDATTQKSKSVVIPQWALGKKIKVEIYALDAQYEAQSISSAISAESVSAMPDGIEITNAVKGATTFSADVTYVGADDAFAIIATYTDLNKMITVVTTPLTSGVTAPVSVTSSGATMAKVFVFDGTGLSDTTITPLCDSVLIQ